ncbi:MAG: hypothetical protein IKD96_07865 [Oscillospiraceae bacterium]|nr:hypothetical protein [Oscillospiraceae bacterium]
MSATNTTGNYGLNQWVATDPVSRQDFNADNLAVDTALNALNAAVNTRATIVTGTYTGSGGYGSASQNSLTFSFVPKLLFIVDGKASYTYMTLIIPGAYSYGMSTAGSSASTLANVLNAASTHRMRTTLSGKTVSWYSTVSAAAQMNSGDAVYRYVAIG